jgi:hypothetical protein
MKSTTARATEIPNQSTATNSSNQHYLLRRRRNQQSIGVPSQIDSRVPELQGN